MILQSSRGGGTLAIKRFPQRIFRDTLTLSVPTGFDRYQAPLEPTVYEIKNIHSQSSNETRKTADNTEVQLKGKVWIYPVYSTPRLDIEALQASTQALGGVMTCTVTSKSGRTYGPFTVLTVNMYPDDEDNLHHYMLGLV